MQNINKILNELHTLSAKSKSDGEHFEKLVRFITAKNYAGAVHHIANYKAGVFQSKYYKTLLALLPHYQLQSPEDAELRIKKLILAIRIGDITKVEAALHTGSLMVLNEALAKDTAAAYPYQDGEVPLMAALAEGDKNIIELLLKAGANLDNAADINTKLNKNGETALHIACRLNLPELIVMLLAKGADPNILDKTGRTSLHFAALYCDERIQLLLLNKGADPTIQFQHRDKAMNAFLIAYSNKHLGSMLLMIEKGFKPDAFILDHAKKHNPDIYTVLKAPYKQRKREIIASGHVGMFAPARNELTPIHNALFAENKELGANLIPLLDKIYFHPNAILKPLLDLGLLAVQGAHKSGIHSGKKLKIILTTNIHVGDVQPGTESTGGLYNLSHTIYSGDFKGNRLQTLGTILHELKHFADQQIYTNVLKPYDDKQRDLFIQIKSNLEKTSTAYLAKYAATAEPNDIDVGVYRTIHSIFTGYKSTQQDAEVLVKVPEIIGYLGVDRGVAWLQKNEPALLEFYVLYFNPACKAYLEQHQLPKQSPETTHRK